MKLQQKLMIGIAAVILVACLVLTSFGVNSFVQNIGYLAAGYLFGRVAVLAK